MKKGDLGGVLPGEKHENHALTAAEVFSTLDVEGKGHLSDHVVRAFLVSRCGALHGL